MKKYLLIVALMIMPMALSAQRMHYKQGERGFFKDGPRNQALMCIEELDLSEKQQEQIHKLRATFRKAQIKREADMKLAHLELRELMRDDVSENKIESALEKVNSIRNDRFDARIKHRLAVKKILTEEQKAKMETWIRSNMGHRRKECAGEYGKGRYEGGRRRHRRF